MMRSEMRRFSLDQIGLNIGAGDKNYPDNATNNSNNESISNASETTPKNSMNENDNKTIQQPKPKKRLSKVADYIKIDFDDLGITLI